MIKRFIFIILGIFLIPTSVFANGLLDGLTSYYELEETGFNYVDSHGSRPFTTGTATTQTTGKINYGQEFDGSTDYLEAGGGSWGTIGTISMWLNPDDDTDKNIWGDDSSSGIQMYFDGAGGLNLYDVGNNKLLAAPASAVNTGSWQHVVFVADGASSAIYVNGVSITPTTNTLTGQLTTTGNIHLGTRYSQDKKFDGKIDEVGVWNKALSASEVSDLYNGGSGLAYSSFSVNTADLKAYFNLNETSGTTANNLVSGGTDGSWSNSANQGADVIYQNGADLGLTDYLLLDTLHYGTGINGTNEITISGWFEINSTDSPTENAPNIIAVNNAGSPYNFEIFLQRYEGSNSGNIDLNLVTSGGSSACGTNSAGDIGISSGIHHIVIRAYTSGGTNYCDLYVDGSLYKSSTGTATWSPTGTSPFVIGTRYYSSNDDYEGKVDEIAVWDKVLDSGQITALYNSGIGSFYDGSSFAAPPYSPSNLNTYASRYYKMEEASGNLVDATGNYDGTTTGIGYQATGKINYGIEFDGTNNDKVNIGDDAYPYSSTSTFSSCQWVYPEGAKAWQNVWRAQETTTINIALQRTGNPSAPYSDTWRYTWYAGGTKFDAVGGSVTTGAWTHICTTNDGTTARLYQDGTEVATSSITSHSITGPWNTAVHLGIRPDVDTEKFDGFIDEVAFFDGYVLTQDDIDFLYASGSPTSNQQYTFSTSAPNTAPTITPIADQIMLEDTRLNVTSAFTIADAEDFISALTLSYTSSNTSVLNSTGAITFNVNTTTGVTDMLQITPNADAFGATNVTIRVTDSGASYAESTFELVVTNVNDAPTISQSIPDVNTTSSLTNQINFTIFDVDSAYPDMSYTLNYVAPLLFSPIDSYTPSYTDGTSQHINVTAKNTYGEANVQIRVTDSEGAFADSNVFNYRVNCDSALLSTLIQSANATTPNNIPCWYQDFSSDIDTDIYIYTWNDFLNSVDSVEIEVYKTTGNQRTLIDSDTSTANSGNFTFNYTATYPSDDLLFIVTMTDNSRNWSVGNSRQFSYSVSQQPDFASQFSVNDGIIYGVLLLFLFFTIGVASQSASLTLIFGLLGLFLANFLVLRLPTYFIWIAGVVVLIILWFMAKLRTD